MDTIKIEITENDRGSYTAHVVGIGDFTRYNCDVSDLHELIDEIFPEEGQNDQSV